MHAAPTPLMLAVALALFVASDRGHAAPCKPIGSVDNFRTHHDNYMLINRMQNNGWAAADEAAVRVQYSFKYTLLGCAPAARPKADGFAPAADPESSEVFVAYTGQFDFYSGTRPSGPVINRISNPGIHWRVGDKGLRTDSFDLSWQAPTTWRIPFFARAHRGPMNTLSNYTQRQDSVGVGLRFSNF
jgi:hypothetical protein